MGDNGTQMFILFPDGTHLHGLKDYKRHTNSLTAILDIIGRKRKDDLIAAENQILSRMTERSNVAENTIIQGPRKEKSKSSMTTTSLLEKYGKCEEILGRGASGSVSLVHKRGEKGTNNSTEQLYAVKRFCKDSQESERAYHKRLISEFCIASCFRHPNIISVFDLLQDPAGHYCEVMEYCPGGDLRTSILRAGKLDALEADCFFKQLVCGVEHLHEKGVAHRDLKPENLLLTTGGILKITDFGKSDCFRLAWEKEVHLTVSHCGTIPYDAPEEYSSGEFDPRAVDVWALGVIYLVMRTGRLPWMAPTKKEDRDFERYIKDRKTKTGYSPIEKLGSALCLNVIYSILDPTPSRRITASQILRSEWCRGILPCEKSAQKGVL